MVKTLAACLAFGLALTPLASLAQSDMSGAMPDKTMADKAMAPKKPMMKHHPTHRKTMAKSTPHGDMTKGADMPKM